MDIQFAIKQVIDRQDLTQRDMHAVMHDIMTGVCTPAQIAGFLVGLRMKGETTDEIMAAAEVMRQLSTRVDVHAPHLVDTCGTGGDSANTFNISTTSAFVAAAAGASVAKHGNRSVSSQCGSADVLEAAGINLELTADQVAKCINEIGIGFMFAPLHHTAMKHAIGPRKELGVRTLFNLLGPLTNPAAAPNQVLGVFDDVWLKPLATVLKQLGSNHVMVLHASDGLDEISICAPTTVAELKAGEINTYEISPEVFDLPRSQPGVLEVNSVDDSLKKMLSVLNNDEGPARHIVMLNAGAAIYVSGITSTLSEGIKTAGQVIASGAAKNKLAALVKLTNTL